MQQEAQLPCANVLVHCVELGSCSSQHFEGALHLEMLVCV